MRNRSDHANEFIRRMVREHGIEALLRNGMTRQLGYHIDVVEMERALREVYHHQTQPIADAAKAELIATHNFPKAVAGIVSEYVHTPDTSTFYQDLVTQSKVPGFGTGGPSR